MPEKAWLTGNRLGFRGPWGTTSASNLRLYMQRLTEDPWVTVAQTMPSRPPMPWCNLQAMTERDLRALYQFIRYLGPGGTPAPASLSPDQEPPQPYLQFPQPPQGDGATGGTDVHAPWVQRAESAPNLGVLAPREARNLGIERKPMKLVVVSQWVRASMAQVPPDESLASRSVANLRASPSGAVRSRVERGGRPREGAPQGGESW